jgi:hypothetical protein
MQGRTVPVPEKYTGVIMNKAESRVDEAQSKASPANPCVDTQAVEFTAAFEEVIIWGHESVAGASTDPYARGIEEWIQASEKVSTVSVVPGRYFFLSPVLTLS